jgi:hypothetical protein
MGEAISLTVRPEQELRIEAIEGFRDNVSPLYDCVYNRTMVGDIRDELPRAGEYDVILCSHVIEHFDKEEAWRLIDLMKQRSRIATVLALPFGEWPQGPVDGNDFEIHRSVWTAADFRGNDVIVRSYGRPPLEYGVAIFAHDDASRWLLRSLRHPVRSGAVKFLARWGLIPGRRKQDTE